MHSFPTSYIHLNGKSCFSLFIAPGFALGFFDVTRAEGTTLKICSYHRDRLGIYWRSRRSTYQVPIGLSNHKGSKMKGDRSVLKRHSVLIKQLTGAIVPMGSGKNKHINYSKNHNKM